MGGKLLLIPRFCSLTLMFHQLFIMVSFVGPYRDYETVFPVHEVACCMFHMFHWMFQRGRIFTSWTCIDRKLIVIGDNFSYVSCYWRTFLSYSQFFTILLLVFVSWRYLLMGNRGLADIKFEESFQRCHLIIFVMWQTFLTLVLR